MLRMQVSDMAGLLREAKDKAATVQADKERLLAMVSRLELEKHRLASAGTPGGSGGVASAGASLPTPGSGPSTRRCEWDSSSVLLACCMTAYQPCLLRLNRLSLTAHSN